MATSSISKSFIIKEKKEAQNFVQLLSNEDKKHPLNKTNVMILSKNMLQAIVDDQRK
ncbi:MAG: hypothetical protein IKW26_07270 [Treponema sp.]|nr:hypothetical protein [Treponema sp.]